MKKISTLIILLGLSTISFAQSEKDLVDSTIRKSKIEGHIYFLADDALKGRQTGTPENKIAAKYLANALRGYGVKPDPNTGSYFQNVPMKEIYPPSKLVLRVNGSELKHKAVIKASKMELNGLDAVFIGHGLEKDYKGVDVSKKVVIIKGGKNDESSIRDVFQIRKQKEELALKNGAIAVVELVKTDKNTWEYIDHRFNSPKMVLDNGNDMSKKGKKASLGYVWVQDEYGKYATELPTKKAIKVDLMMGGAIEKKVQSQNVVGYVEGTDPKLKNEFIIYSAHYDHVGIGSPDETGDTIYNGARDNAVGATTVLSAAENIAAHPTKRSALFILFTAEEKGLLGSKYYVENPIFPLQQMVFCFNSDNGGYNDKSKTTIVGLERTTVAPLIKKASQEFELEAIDDPAPEQGLFDRSDNVHFAAKGIPAPTFSLGFTSFSGEVTKYYHRPGDHADSLDYDYLTKFFGAYVLASRYIANSSKTPFWTKGDKYESAGKKLYQK